MRTFTIDSVHGNTTAYTFNINLEAKNNVGMHNTKRSVARGGMDPQTK